VLSEGAVVSDGQCGDFDSFFHADFPQLVGFLCKAGFDLEVAKDAAAEAMTAALESWTSIGSPRAWVRRVGFRTAVEYVRRGREGVARAVEGGWAVAAAVDTGDIAAIEEGAIVMQVLSRLPPRQRQVMAWWMEGSPPAEIGQRLELPQTTVRSHLRHARARLRDIYEAEYRDAPEADR
jgi:RNA polymerase sigma factor (sigma-70 family)